MLNTQSNAFKEKFGEKPIFAGVYTDKSMDEMIDEIQLLSDEGINAVYLENINSLKDIGQYSGELSKIGRVLDIVQRKDLPIKIGVNLLPDRKGTESIVALNLAKEFNLDFIVDDMIAGTYTLSPKYADDTVLNPISLHKDYLAIRKTAPDCAVFGGILPPYVNLVSNESVAELVTLASERSDAILVKAKDGESEVPLSRIEEYRRYTQKPLILSSKVTPKNIYGYVPYVDAFIVGSALYKNGSLNPDALRQVQYAVNRAL